MLGEPVVALYLDDNVASQRVARQLRAAGHTIYLPDEVNTSGADDQTHLDTAIRLGAVLVSKDQADFEKLHERLHEIGRQHAGILRCREIEIGQFIVLLERAGRLLTSESAHDQYMILDMFKTEGLARNYVASLTSANA